MPSITCCLRILSDAYPPRILYAGIEPRPSPTLALSVYFYATAPNSRRSGDDFIISEAVGTRAAQSVVGSQLRLWSRAGRACWPPASKSAGSSELARLLLALGPGAP